GTSGGGGSREWSCGGTTRAAGFGGRCAPRAAAGRAAAGGAGPLPAAVPLLTASKLNPAEAQAKDLAGAKTADAVVGLNELRQAGIPAGAIKPFDILVGHNPGTQALRTVVTRLRATPGNPRASPPVRRRHGGRRRVQ